MSGELVTPSGKCDCGAVVDAKPLPARLEPGMKMRYWCEACLARVCAEPRAASTPDPAALAERIAKAFHSHDGEPGDEYLALIKDGEDYYETVDVLKSWSREEVVEIVKRILQEG